VPGLWGITVPKEYGGAASAGTLAEVIATIAAADGSIGQIPQNHFYAVEVLRVNGSEAQKRFFFDRVLPGDRFGNALAELGTKTSHDRKTRLSRNDMARLPHQRPQVLRHRRALCRLGPDLGDR
jgi:alkylation response protein AidB-like acyl-CoA dehydrogenase